MLAKGLASKTKTLISFVSKGFPYKDQIEDLFIVLFSFCIFPSRYVFNFLLF